MMFYFIWYKITYTAVKILLYTVKYILYKIIIPVVSIGCLDIKQDIQKKN